ncbi:cadherin-7-like [Anabas testudineus]|uniref:cadherin-7-like n=1 Tax=Anabas testudineus TaxID=64144 RepID=UPI000E460036|nr:cadherin-7-like [Anabas testudineus]
MTWIYNTASVLTQRAGFLQWDQSVHVLSVVISDRGSPPLSSTNTLSITVCDCDLDGNRRSCSRGTSPQLVVGLNLPHCRHLHPHFACNISFFQISNPNDPPPPPPPVGSVSAHDPDFINSPVRYSIDRKSDSEQYFNIDRTSGVIRIFRPLDRETVALHNITVLAAESLDPSKVGKAVVLVSVLDVNDNAPSFAIEYKTFVCENSRSGQIIETLSAVDRDEPERGHHFLFSLTAEAAGNFNFTLRDNKDNTASVLTQRAGFLQWDQSVHVLSVVISDRGSPPLSSTNTLSITVCDCDLDGNRRSCSRGTSPQLVVGLNVAATAVTCILTLLGIATVIVVMRHRRAELLMMDDERDVRENVVRYDDEGGGEEDTEAFDMFTLRHSNQTNTDPVRTESTLDKNRLFQEFIRDKLQEADLDLTAPPYDSLQTYAFEGSASAAESLSSLNSSESEPDYGSLKEWGPKFRKLRDLYGHWEGGGINS